VLTPGAAPPGAQPPGASIPGAPVGPSATEKLMQQPAPPSPVAKPGKKP
jgi:hypothetical protein